MKVVRKEILFDHAGAASNEWFRAAIAEVEKAIESVKWPHGSGDFAINPINKGNGVKPIKNTFIASLAQKGWQPELRLKVYGERRPGPIDAAKWIKSESRYFAAEWETGNISSSHRALNKLTMGILRDTLLGGVLVLPSRAFYRFLTDRIGNFQELEPYFPVWKSLDTAKKGVLAVIEVEHDRTSSDVPQIEKGTDGRALL